MLACATQYNRLNVGSLWENTATVNPHAHAKQNSRAVSAASARRDIMELIFIHMSLSEPTTAFSACLAFPQAFTTDALLGLSS